MYGYGGMGHYYARQNYDKRCTACDGSGSAETDSGFMLPCQECNGTGLCKDPEVSSWSFHAAILLIVLSIGGLVVYGLFGPR